ncbi:MAG: YbaK/EbsC family protein [Clostridia bacterium]|nr:YbaK/EbsC family protein [Clostridia bacterium]
MNAIDRVREYLAPHGLADGVMEFTVSSATVALAAVALGTEEERIAKTLSFHMKDGGVALIVMAGDAKIDNHKYKAQFAIKAKMLSFEEVEPLTGFPVGGVCPFAPKEGVKIYLDASLRRFETVYPACGTPASAIKITPDRLSQVCTGCEWIDVTKTAEENG